MDTEGYFWQKICSEDNFYLAWQRVKTNRGCPGVDHVSIKDFETNLHNNLVLLRSLLRQGLYEPSPLIAKEINKHDGRKRLLKIPTVKDRIVQEAVLLVIQPEFEKDFLNCSYGYRQNKSALMAVKKVETLLQEGFNYIIDSDIKDFFDTVHKKLIVALFSEKIKDKRIVSLIKKWIQYDMPPEIGIPQGIVLSPLLANLYLHNLDIAVTAKSKGYIRYCDDFVVLCKSQDEAKNLLEFIDIYIENELLLTLNKEKTRICNLNEGFTFLGFHFSSEGKKPSFKSIEKLKSKIDRELKFSDKITEEQLKNRLKTIIRGWQNYFGLSGIQQDKLLKEVEDMSRQYNDSIALDIFKSALYIQNSQPHKAYELITQKPFISSEEGELHYQRGIIFELLGLDEQAFDEYYQALKLEPSNAETFYQLGRKLTKLGKIERAIKFLQKAIQLSPNNFEFYLAIAEAYQKWGLYGSAEKAIMQAKQLKPELSLSLELKNSLLKEENFKFKLTHEDISLFIKLFSGREGLFAKQWINEYGKIGYSPIHKPLEQEDVLKHINGKHTLGIYLLRMDNTVNFAVLDLDVSKKIIMQQGSMSIDLWQSVLSDAVKIKRFFKNLEINVYMESSGWKGIHIWIFFEAPIKATEVREFLKTILKKVGPPPEGINREIFPLQQSIRENAFGSLIKLPLGIHRLTGKRCLFIDNEGNPVENQIAHLWNIVPVKIETFRKAQSLLTKEESFSIKSLSIENLHSVKKVLEKCNVLKYLYTKAQQEKDLTHFERLTILNTLGHLGQEGKKAIHIIISNCYNYSYDITEKWLGRLSKSPCSCPKIREWLNHITPVIGCHCDFNLDRDTYPSPVIHAGIKPLKRSPSKIVLNQQPKITQDSIKIDELVNEYLRLKQNKKELENKLSEIERKFEELFNQKGIECIELKIGNLKRIKNTETKQWIVEI